MIVSIYIFECACEFMCKYVCENLNNKNNIRFFQIKSVCILFLSDAVVCLKINARTVQYVP